MALRVLHLNAGNLYGGVETVLVTIARERLCCPGMESHFALCFPGRVADELTAAGAPPTILGAVRGRYPWQVWRARNRFRQLLHDEAFDVVVCHMPWSLAVFGSVVKQCARPLVFWMHGPASGESWIERWARRSVPDLVLCNSEFTAGSLPRLFRKLPLMRVLFCPVRQPVSRLTPSQRSALRAEMETPPEYCVIIQVGRLEPWKGQDVHLKALSLLRGTPGWTCWLAGGAQRPGEFAWLAQLKEMARQLGVSDKVRFLGERRDVENLLQAADIYCQPNVEPEPFGIAIVEAMGAGLPVITARLGGATEIVDDTCGRLIAKGNPEEVAEALRGMVADPTLRARLGSAGRGQASRLCAPKHILSELESALGELVAEKGFPLGREL